MNRAAIGATARGNIKDRDGTMGPVFREVSGGRVTAGNSLVPHVGFGAAREADAIAVTWPDGKTRQVFRHVPADRTIAVGQGGERYAPVVRRPTPQGA